ncbi:MAG: RluA family pseudouridine synthase [Polymorphobacter sp.]
MIISTAELAARILYIDAHCLILNKPAGMAVHPGPQTPDSLEDHLYALREGFHRPPQPAHRLDRDTSGCLVLGRHPRALKRLTQLFTEGAIGKTYWAVVDGAPVDDAGLVDAPLFKVSTRETGWRMIIDARGKAARTRWQLLDRAAAANGNRSTMAFMPETGRTHQVRVHAAALGCPITGDPVYGAGLGPMRLHARQIVIPYMPGQPPINVTAPLPDDWPAGVLTA